MFYAVEQFHFDQSKARSEIRLREGRMKPIDILSKHLDPSDDRDIEIDEPYVVFKVLLFYLSEIMFVMSIYIFIILLGGFCYLLRDYSESKSHEFAWCSFFYRAYYELPRC